MRKTSSLKKTKITPFSVAIMAFLLIYIAILVILFVWAIFASVKDPYTFDKNVIGWPQSWHFENYALVMEKFRVHVSSSTTSYDVYLPELLVNGFLYALGCAFFQTLAAFIVSYLCAKFDYKLSKVIYAVVVVVMILPIVGSLPAEIQMAKNLGIYDQLWGQWIMKFNFLGLYFLVFYAFFKRLPNAYIEAAKIDGASNFKILIRIILPMSMTLFGTVVLLNFITYWNDFSIPLAYLPTHPTIAVGLLHMVSTTDNLLAKVPIRIASAMVLFIPILIIFLIFHKKLLGNLTMGGLKG